jgi:hypothetical protein
MQLTGLLARSIFSAALSIRDVLWCRRDAEAGWRGRRWTTERPKHLERYSELLRGSDDRCCPERSAGRSFWVAGRSGRIGCLVRVLGRLAGAADGRWLSSALDNGWLSAVRTSVSVTFRHPSLRRRCVSARVEGAGEFNRSRCTAAQGPWTFLCRLPGSSALRVLSVGLSVADRAVAWYVRRPAHGLAG